MQGTEIRWPAIGGNAQLGQWISRRHTRTFAVHRQHRSVAQQPSSGTPGAPMPNQDGIAGSPGQDAVQDKGRAGDILPTSGRASAGHAPFFVY